MAAYADRAGLELYPCRPDFGATVAQQNAQRFNQWIEEPFATDPKIWQGLQILKSYTDLLVACQRADLLIASPLRFAAAMVHETIHIPWITATVTPSQFWCPATEGLDPILSLPRLSLRSQLLSSPPSTADKFAPLFSAAVEGHFGRYRPLITQPDFFA